MGDKRRIAVVTMGVKLGRETKGFTRFLTVAQMLSDAGFSVELLTTSFQHWDKAQRDIDDPAYREYDFDVSFFYEPGYHKNLDLRRIHSHSVAAKNLSAHLEACGPYDLVYFVVPPNDVALAAAKYAEAHGIPAIADVNDLWPEAMRMVVDIPLISDVAFSGIAHDAREMYKRLSAVVGTSDEYAARPFTDCRPDIERVTCYVGSDLAAFDAGVREHSCEIDKPDGQFWVTYAGMIGASYDIETFVRAIDDLGRSGHGDVRGMVLGDGPDLPRLKELAGSLGCAVSFLGYQDYGRMAAYLAASDVTLNSLVRKAAQSIVTKIGDYLAAGRPMINTGSSREFCGKVESDGFGVNVRAEDVDALAGAIIALKNDPAAREQMGTAARRIAEEQFDRKTSYKAIVDLVRRTIEANSQAR